jgi:predicted alpha/beta-hydrolase family hydrolase
MPEVDPYGGFASAPFPVGGRRRSRSRRARRGGADPKPEPKSESGAPPLAKAEKDLDKAAETAGKVMGGKIEGGRRSRSTAKKIASELKRVAKKAKKLTMKLMKMRRRK